ncbi:CU044_5270 family protein [Actinomadura sp. HBU206391]|uniref:CU044_5270 family protein n=1 Tax=Actinomadura sp. HBU206391 TaxID=2731692 RepID=UPI00164FDCAB|nr:CU044_5270 family protein [Actinomadura sp. HBU206391]MBC6457592.1 CU044_5270 family protein [Actinomadura sp. HBU206391]
MSEIEIEIEMVGDLYDEPPAPTPQVVALARARMTGPDDVAGPVPVRRDRRRFARRADRPARRARPVVLGVLATGVAAAVVAVLVVPGGEDAGPHATSPPVPGTSKQMVLAAADQAAMRPMKRYRLVHYRSCNSVPVRARTGNYVMHACHEYYAWSAREKAGGSASWGRDLPTRPLTAKDAAAWRRAGSPSTFPHPQAPRHLYKTHGTPWRKDRGGKPGGNMLINSPRDPFNGAEPPADPKKLAAVMVPYWQRMADHIMGEGEQATAGAKLVWTDNDVLDRSLPPKALAGLIRVLADQPGIESVGRTTDPLGRPGVALTGLRPGYNLDPEAVIREELLFDAETGERLASRRIW